METKLSMREIEALEWMRKQEAVLVTRIDDEERDCFGSLIRPSERVIKSLVKKGLVYITEEDGDWTPMYQVDI